MEKGQRKLKILDSEEVRKTLYKKPIPDFNRKYNFPIGELKLRMLIEGFDKQTPKVSLRLASYQKSAIPSAASLMMQI